MNKNSTDNCFWNNNYKKSLFSLLILFICTLSSDAQIAFEEGYIIDNEGTKINCFIKNKDWRTNPEKFEYKTTLDAEVQVGQLDAIQEFGIVNRQKYVRTEAAIDQSSSELKKLSLNRKAEFQTKTVFLKVIIEGEANLYYYEMKNLRRFFYSIKGDSIIPLIYKKYLAEEQLMKENNRYQQQIFLALKCKITSTSPDKIQYTKKSLANYFEKYNECKKSDFINFEKIYGRKKFSLSIKPGVIINSLTMFSSGNKTVQHKNLIGYEIGVSLEQYLPFNNSKWSLLAEPNFQFINADKTSPNIFFPNETVNTVLDYQSIEIPIGIRHYIYLNEKSTLFINSFAIIDFSLNLEINHRNSFTFTNDTPLLNFSLGAGYEYQSKYSIEVRYLTRRNLLNDSINFSSDLRGVTILLGYRFHKKKPSA